MGFRSSRGRRTAVHSSSFPDEFEVGRILNYAGKLIRTVRDRSRSARAIRQWLMEDGREVGLEPLENAADVQRDGAPSSRSGDVHLESMSELAQRLEDHAAAVTAGCSPLQTNLNFVSELFELDALDAEIVGLLVRYRLHSGFQNLIDHVLDAREFKPEMLIGALIGHSAVAASDRLNPRMPLLDSGMVGRSNSAVYGLSRYYEVPHRLIDSLTTPAATPADVRRALIGPELASELKWAHFDHVGAERDLIAGVIRGAIAARASGVNILIWGKLGTGKTSLVAAVARHLDLTLYRAGENEDSTVPDRADRLPMLRWAQRLLSRQSGAILIFDEAEDLIPQGFEMRADASASKVALNRLLESNPIPTIWTSNNIGCFDPALLGRFTLVVELRTPPEKVRAQIWQNLALKSGLDLPSDALRGLAREFDQPPALAGNAILAARLAGGGMDRLRLAIAGAVRATGRKQSTRGPTSSERFDAGLTTADVDLVKLTDRLVQSKTRAFSLLLSGPPGTGKSAYARYLAEQLDVPVVSKRASDLLNAHVGDSEKAIARAFEEARDGGALLILDEVDSLLSDRRHAVRSWEVTQVNELLTQLEAHTLPVVATTNFLERLDPASLRRFTFKIHLEPMTPVQVRLAFRLFFGRDLTGQGGDLTDLTPGDFRVVRSKADILGVEDPTELMAMLVSESEAKPGRTRQIGYGA
jgi:transitional endoplasmic reticulum ATPase